MLVWSESDTFSHDSPEGCVDASLPESLLNRHVLHCSNGSGEGITVGGEVGTLVVEHGTGRPVQRQCCRIESLGL